MRGESLGQVRSILLAAIVVTAISAAAGEPLALAERSVSPFDPATVVATVDGHAITLGELVFRFANLPASVRRGYLLRDQPFATFLEDLAANTLVAAAAAAEDLDSSPLYERLMAIQREQVLRDLYARAHIVEPLVGEVLGEKYRNDPRFATRDRVHLRHILLTVEPDGDDDGAATKAVVHRAEELRGKVIAGADFATLARTTSADVSAADGGDLGWVDPSTLAQPLVEAALATPIGEVSEVLVSELGVHLIEVVDRRRAGTVPFEVVRELLLQEAVAEHASELEAAVEADRKRLAEESNVVLYPDRLPW